MQQCQVCGKGNPPGVEYCEDCGASLKTPSSSVGQAGQAGQVGQAGQTSTQGDAANASQSMAHDQVDDQSQVGDAGASGASGATGGANSPGEAGGVQGAQAEIAEIMDGRGAGANVGAKERSGGDVGAGEQMAGAMPPGDRAGASASAAPGAGRPRLAARRYGAPTGDEIPLSGERLVIGRFDPETGPVDIDLSAAPEGEQISRQHGELYREEEGQWFVRDLGSTNGVFVKGKDDSSFGPRITAPRALANGDEVAFGNARFIFLTE